MSRAAPPRVATRPVFRMRPSRVRRIGDAVVIRDEIHEWVQAAIGQLEPFQRKFLDTIVWESPTPTRDPTQTAGNHWTDEEQRT